MSSCPVSEGLVLYLHPKFTPSPTALCIVRGPVDITCTPLPSQNIQTWPCCKCLWPIPSTQTCELQQFLLGPSYFEAQHFCHCCWWFLIKMVRAGPHPGHLGSYLKGCKLRVGNWWCFKRARERKYGEVGKWEMISSLIGSISIHPSITYPPDASLGLWTVGRNQSTCKYMRRTCKFHTRKVPEELETGSFLLQGTAPVRHQSISSFLQIKLGRW